MYTIKNESSHYHAEIRRAPDGQWLVSIKRPGYSTVSSSGQSSYDMAEAWAKRVLYQYERADTITIQRNERKLT